jgi:hypothetical protein
MQSAEIYSLTEVGSALTRGISDADPAPDSVALGDSSRDFTVQTLPDSPQNSDILEPAHDADAPHGSAVLDDPDAPHDSGALDDPGQEPISADDALMVPDIIGSAIQTPGAAAVPDALASRADEPRGAFAQDPGDALPNVMATIGGAIEDAIDGDQGLAAADGQPSGSLRDEMAVPMGAIENAIGGDAPADQVDATGDEEPPDDQPPSGELPDPLSEVSSAIESALNDDQSPDEDADHPPEEDAAQPLGEDAAQPPDDNATDGDRRPEKNAIDDNQPLDEDADHPPDGDATDDDQPPNENAFGHDQPPAELPSENMMDFGQLPGALDGDPPPDELATTGGDARPTELPNDIAALPGAIEDAVDDGPPPDKPAFPGDDPLRNETAGLSGAIQSAVGDDDPPGDVPDNESPVELPDGFGAVAAAIGEAVDEPEAAALAGDEESAPADGRDPDPDADAAGETGMTVHDDITTPKNCCVHSVSHLPPLVTSDEKDAISECLLSRFVESRAIPSVDRRLQLIQYLQRQKVNALCSNNILEARRLHNILQEFQRVLLRVRAQDFHEQRLDALEKKQRDTANSLAQFREETDLMIQDEQQRQAERHMQLSTEHDLLRQDFDSRWNRGNYLLRFAKPSPYLLQINKIEWSLVLSKDLEQAELYRVMVTQLEKAESEAAQRRAQTEMRGQQERMIARQEAEVRALEELGVKNMELLKSQREQQERALVVRLHTVESELEVVRATRPLSLPPMRSSWKVEESSMTPRTLQRYAAFKTNVKQPRVIVRPLGTIEMKKNARKPFEASLAASF